MAEEELRHPTGGNVSREADSYLLASKDLRAKHPLNLKVGELDAHHIISDNVVSKLSTFRTLQMKRKGWSMNHGKNLVLLSGDTNICCYYQVPIHSSGHTDSAIADSFYGSKAKMSKDIKKVGDTSEKKAINALTGYHKVVAIKLALALKPLDCNTKWKTYMKEIDEVSELILGYISDFKLLLIANGKRFHKTQQGCGTCGSRTAHFTPNKFIFFNRRHDKKETAEYTKDKGGQVQADKKYVKDDKSYFASENKNKVYEDLYKEVKTRVEVELLIQNKLEDCLNSVAELKKIL
ncbi:AHH domain-containing protein [Moritella viscosa]